MKDTIMYCACIWFITLNILILIKKLSYITNKGYSEIICTKYGGSRMNDVHTICLADIIGLPAKVVWSMVFFLKKKVIFVQLLCRPPASRPGSQHLKCI